MADFATIQDRTLRLAENREPLPESLLLEIPDIINQQIRRAVDMHTWRCTETEVVRTTSAGVRTLGIYPTDWRRQRSRPYLLSNTGGITLLEWLPSEEEARRRYSEAVTAVGAPCHLLDRATDVAVYPFSGGASDYVDLEYRVHIPYYGYLAALVAGTDTNWFTVNAENFCVYAAVGEIFARLGRPQAVDYLFTDEARVAREPVTQADREFSRLVRSAKLERAGTDLTFVPKRDAYANWGQRRGA